MSENPGARARRFGLSRVASPQRLWRIGAVALLVCSFSAAAQVLAFSTFLGGSAADGASAVRVDRKGNVYVAGVTTSPDFPTTANAFQRTGPGDDCYWNSPGGLMPGPCTSLFVSKFSPEGALLYSTYVGRHARQYLIGMDIDDSGAVYLAAQASDRLPDLDLKPLNAFATTQTYMVYVVKLRPETSSVEHATLLPKTNGDLDVRAIAADKAGAVYLTGGAGPGLPTINAFQAAHKNPTYLKSSDSGQSWQTGTVASGAGLVSMVAVDPRNPRTVYIGFETGLYISTDSGGHWTPFLVGAPSSSPNPGAALYPRQLVFDASRAGTMYLVTSSWQMTTGPWIYKTTDAGSTWTPASAGITQIVRNIALDPSAPATLYAGADDGVYKSTDGGATWSPTSLKTTGPYDIFSRPVAIDPRTPSTVYAATPNGLMKSVDSGASWNEMTGPTFGAARAIDQFTLDPVDPRTLLIAINDAVYRSTDGGEHWEGVKWPRNGSSSPQATALLVDPVVHTTVWAATSAGVLVSADSGATWTATPTSTPETVIRGIAASPDGTTYAIVDADSMNDAFVMKIDASGANLLYSTYLGGSGYDLGRGIAVDPQGRAFIAGTTDSFDFPGAEKGSKRLRGGRDAFISMLDASGQLGWSTFLGGSARDEATAIALDPAGNIHVAGETESPDFPLQNPSQAAPARAPDAFVTKMKGDGSGLLFSTYIGGSGYETPRAIAAGPDGNSYVAGTTSSNDLPVAAAVQPRMIYGPSTFAAAWKDSTGVLQFLTYLGNGSSDWYGGVAVDGSGSVYVAGSTTSDFPLNYAFQNSLGGAADAFLSKLAPLASGPAIAVAGAADAASYGATVAPGELVAIFGSYMAANTTQAGGFPLPPQLSDLRATINGVPAPLYYVSPWQVNAQVPYETSPGTASLQVTSNAGSATVQINVATTAPAIFSVDASGRGPGAIQHGATGALVTDASPAVAGEIVAIYCTGLGAVNPAIATGAAAGVPLSWATSQMQAVIGGQAAEVSYAGLTPTLAGVYQINARVPSGLAPGAQPVQIVAGTTPSNTVTLQVK